jgi:hypothetical protein
MGSIPDKVFFFSLPNPSSCNMAVGFTQPVMEMSVRKCFWGGKAWQVLKADNLTTVFEPIGLHGLLQE